MTLATKAESEIRNLRDIEGVSVRVDGDVIREIHVVTRSERNPKQIVRDIQTMLRAKVGVAIDHRVVSVAQARHDDAPPLASPAAFTASAAAPAPAPAPAAAAAAERENSARFDDDEPVARDERIRFEGVNLFVSGPRTQAQVELRWKGLPRMGSASGYATRDESHRLIAQATASAVQEFLSDPVAINVQGVEFVEIGRRRLAVVCLTLLAHRNEKALTGSCIIEHDTPQAVVLAALAALNRVVGGMRVKEPTEYVLRAGR
jgi:ribosomal protein L12E/L44/L45/RPP1/RPP2